jgi:hypothetical protein
MPERPRAMFRIIVDTFAGIHVYPILTHVFNGMTESEAEERYQAHLRGCPIFGPCGRTPEQAGCRNQIRFRGWYEPSSRGHLY